MTKKLFAPLVLAFSAVLLVPTTASALCVKVPEANLRSGPGTHYKKTWTVFRYMPLRQIGSKGSWYHVADVDGDKHWVYAPLVTKGLRCAVIKKDHANVRRGPGTRYPMADLGTLERYYSFKVVGEKGKWLKVRDDLSNSGWIFKPLLWVQ